MSTKLPHLDPESTMTPTVQNLPGLFSEAILNPLLKVVTFVPSFAAKDSKFASKLDSFTFKPCQGSDKHSLVMSALLL